MGYAEEFLQSRVIIVVFMSLRYTLDYDFAECMKYYVMVAEWRVFTELT